MLKNANFLEKAVKSPQRRGLSLRIPVDLRRLRPRPHVVIPAYCCSFAECVPAL